MWILSLESATCLFTNHLNIDVGLCRRFDVVHFRAQGSCQKLSLLSRDNSFVLEITLVPDHNNRGAFINAHSLWEGKDMRSCMSDSCYMPIVGLSICMKHYPGCKQAVKAFLDVIDRGWVDERKDEEKSMALFVVEVPHGRKLVLEEEKGCSKC